jgi:hypothetical protein
MLEYAVRPYQTPDSHGRIIIPSTPTSTSERAVLTWGATGTVPNAQPQGFNVVCCNYKVEEIERQGEIAQIPITQEDIDQGHTQVFRSNQLKHKQTKSNKCDSPLDQYLGQEFGLDDTGDVTVDLGWAGTPDASDEACGVTWKLNNNTTAA